MGKKRSRVPGEPRVSKSSGTEGSIQHMQTLEEEVRESRDVEFASEKKESNRAKRQRMVDMGDESVERLTNRKVGNRHLNARTAGLEMWKRAALKRKGHKPSIVDSDGAAIDGSAVEEKIEAKIVEQARQQRAEIRTEDRVNDHEDGRKSAQEDVDASLRENAVADSEDDDDGIGYDGRSLADSTVDWQSTIGEEDRDLEFLDGSKVTEADELALSLFNTAKDDKPALDGIGTKKEGDEGGKILLADIVLQKLQEKEDAAARLAAIAADPAKAERDRKIAEVYGLVGNIMAKYRSGKIPKPFKIIPKLRNWEDLLYMTRPDEWSPAAVCVATRTLSSNLSGKDVTSFYSDILLPRCIQDIADHKKLNYHLYQALIKAIYKPDAFCKGILFPLCKDEACTLRQATVISSVVSKVSIPMLHSAASLVYMSQLPFNPVTCLLITALVEKKYGLPYRAVDSLVDWFIRMKEDTRPLPVLWHKCLLSFAQRYKSEVTRDQKDKLKGLMRQHTHRLITPEIRRELFSSRSRGEILDPDANTVAHDIAEAAMVD